MVTAKRQQQRYTNRDRKALLARFHAYGCVNEKQISRVNNVKYQTWQGWRKMEQQITSSKRHSRKATLGGQGRKPMIPFAADLLYTCASAVPTTTKKSEEVGFESLRCLLLRFCARNRFTHRKPCVSKLSQVVLDSVWLGYAAHFHSKYADYPKSTILNADETGLYFDMPPGSTLAEIGQPSKVDPKPRSLLVDNLECHVSEKAHDKIAEASFSVNEPLPPNSTSKCQPLDVGIMGPLKAMLKMAWLLEDDEGNGDDLTLQQKRMDIIKRTIRVWDKISTETVKGAFEKSIPSVMQF
ncbi:hypothetical protein DYB37_008379 [Aphanomyces astaci]|uniref:DDE-1 domain-containing protein n=1 Tax=Aphanomyces astaci TaxID=112090 RepID=A0A3R6YS62_APHAT|nr:hypothetical protein DYB37_008379 [Aphanomyces astaci]